MNSLKSNFIYFALYIAFLLSFMHIHDQPVSREVHVNFSLIGLRSPRNLLRRVLCCCSSSSSSSDSSSDGSGCNNSGSLDISSPNTTMHVWSATGTFGGFGSPMTTYEPRTEIPEEVSEEIPEETSEKACCCQASQSSSSDGDKFKSEDIDEDDTNCSSCSCSCKSSSNGSRNVTNPYGAYNGNGDGVSHSDQN